jgi:hypothetical protein
MESSVPTEQCESAIGPAWSDVASPQMHPTLINPGREQCSSCGAALASDQRYCVECGQRRGPARVPLTGEAAQRRDAVSAPPRRAGVNSTLVAVIGTLLLAMGVGVLIGRSGNSAGGKTPPAQVVTITGASGTAPSAGEATTSQAAAAGASKAAKSGGASTTVHAKSVTKTATKPHPKAVKVGSPGKGAGYQHGHFTGNFFGPEAE